MASFYEENPEAFSEAARRKDFVDSLLAGTGLELFLASDPDGPHQARAQDEVRLVIERAWQANLTAQRAPHALRSIAFLPVSP